MPTKNYQIVIQTKLYFGFVFFCLILGKNNPIKAAGRILGGSDAYPSNKFVVKSF
jgi:hypothetical protein